MGAATPWATWTIAAAATAGVLFRPFAWPEFVWAVAGAVLLVLLGLLPLHDALIGASRGTDVYLFLIGMMLLSELARQEGLFDWVAAHAARLSGGSAVAPVHPDLRRRHTRDGLPLERRHRGGAHPRRRRRGPHRSGEGTAALSLHLRLHRQCGELRPADLQPGQSRDLRQPHAAALAVDQAIRAALGRLDRGDLCCPAPDPGTPSPGRGLRRHRITGSYARRSVGRSRHCAHRPRAPHRILFRRRARPADLRRRHGHGHRRAALLPPALR